MVEAVIALARRYRTLYISIVVGAPDCSQCGCMASAGLSAVGDYRPFGLLPLRSIYNVSDRIGETTAKMLGRSD